jgi:hypothetical protein
MEIVKNIGKLGIRHWEKDTFMIGKTLILDCY